MQTFPRKLQMHWVTDTQFLLYIFWTQKWLKYGKLQAHDLHPKLSNQAKFYANLTNDRLTESSDVINN